MSFLFAGIVEVVALAFAYGFLLAGGAYAKHDAAQALLFGSIVALCLVASHWLVKWVGFW